MAVVSCAQWMGWWRGPTLLNGVFLLTLIRTPLHPRGGDASCLEDLSYYPTVHLSHVTSVASQMHQDLERVQIVLQIQQCSNMRLHSIRISVDGMWYKILLHCQLISRAPDHIKLLYT